MENFRKNKDKINAGKEKKGAGTEDFLRSLDMMSEEDAFGVNPSGGRRGSLVQRTPPGKGSEGQSTPPRTADTPYMTPPAGSLGGSDSEGGRRRGLGKELKVRLHKMGAEVPRSTPIPPVDQSLTLPPARETETVMPPFLGALMRISPFVSISTSLEWRSLWRSWRPIRRWISRLSR